MHFVAHYSHDKATDSGWYWGAILAESAGNGMPVTVSREG
jgi:hypothetical protein